ncbi:MAG: SDR family NAD(P)-dependent oxidoreductase [Planctomycetota bacterium]
MTHPGETCIVVGASSGIGAALARRLAADGCKVALLARRRERIEQLARDIDARAGRRLAMPLVHDVADTSSVDTAFDAVEAELGDVTAVYYVAGVMPEVGADEFDTAKDVQQFQTNTLGSIAWCNAAARRFLPRRRGFIVGISSVAGDRGRAKRPGYCASKAGQDVHLESLRNRLWDKGIHVTTIRPGFVDTEMTAGLGLKGAISAEQAADAIVRAARKNKGVVYVPFKWRIIMGVVKSMPSFLFKRLAFLQ